MNSATPIVSGALNELDLDKILAVTSLGRVLLRLELSSPRGETLGTMMLKAGRVIDATAGPLRGEAALEQLLAVDRLARFRIWRETRSLPNVAPICNVTDVASRAARPVASEPGQRRRARIMEGSLADFDVATLLGTLSLGRQYIELSVLSGDGARLGQVVIKAGKVLSALAQMERGRSAIAALLAAPKHARFEVVHLDGALDPELAKAKPIGSVAQILLEIAEPPASAATGAVARAHVMSGLLSEFDLSTLLQTIGVGRQHLLLEIHDEGTILGAIQMKASMLLSVSAGPDEGLAALARLVAAPKRGQFKVFRIAGSVPVDPIGPIGPLLIQVMWPQAAAAPWTGATAGSTADGHTDGSRTRVSRTMLGRTRLLLGAGVVGAISFTGAAIWLVGDRDSGRAPLATLTTQPVSAEHQPPAPAPVPSSAVPRPQEPVVPLGGAPATADAPDERPAEPPRPRRRVVHMAVWRAQAVLDRLGYEVGLIDNVFGPRTAAAVSAFQEAEGLRASGVLDRATVRALRARSQP